MGLPWRKYVSLVIEIKVVPRSGKSQLILDKSGILKCFLKAAPKKGKANKEVIEVVAKFIEIRKGEIEIVSGFNCRKKLLKIQTDMSYEQLLEKLGGGIQKKVF